MKIHCKYDALIPWRQLKPHPKNRNKHPEEQVERLTKLIRYQGVRAPIIVSRLSGFIVKGHGTLAAMKPLCEEFNVVTVPVAYQDFDDEEQEYLFVQSDNAIAAWAELDLSGINSDIGDFGPFDIDLLGIKDFEVTPEDKYGDGEGEDEVPATPVVACSRPGDLFILGAHRLLCGDSTRVEDVQRLMNGEGMDLVYTDPPYGINLETNYKKRYGHEKGSSASQFYGEDCGIDLLAIIRHSEKAKELFIWGADNYPDCLSRGGSWVVWDKSVPAVDGIASDFELCWSRERHHYSMVRKLWKGAKAREETGQEGDHKTRWGHPTQKPIELALYFFEHWGKKANTVVDFFGGSGTTLIACEKAGKRCRMVEISPNYVDLILDRFAKFSGIDPQRLNDDGTTTPWSEIKKQS